MGLENTVKNVNIEKYELEMNIRSFEKFLKEHETTDKITHTAFGPPWGKFNIPDEDNDKFFELYNKLVNKTELFMLERPKKIGALLVDLDWKFKEENKRRQYSENEIVYMVRKVNDILKKYCILTKKTLKAFICEKPKPSFDQKNNLYKDGFHICYPYVPLSQEMRYLVLDELKNVCTFNNLNHVNDISDIIDVSIVRRNGWMMYGSRKHNGQYYTLSAIYDYQLNKEDIKNYKSIELTKLFSNRKFNDNDEIKFKQDLNKTELNIKIDKVMEKYERKKKELIIDDDINDDDNNIQIEKKPSIEQTRAVGEIDYVVELVNILSNKRSEVYDTWIAVGWALHNINIKYLELFKNFSKKCPSKYNEKNCVKVWINCKNGGLSIASLHLWARQDNPIKYAEIMRKMVNKLFEEADSGTEYDIAKVAFELYKHNFKCSSINDGLWYEFQNHRWVELEKAHTLKKKFSEELTKEFAHLNSYYYTKCGTVDGSEKDNYFKKANNVSKIISNLKRTPFKSRLIEECSQLFFDRTFEEKLDSNPDLIGYDNGVYDLLNDCFRDGTPDDYLTFSVGYNWNEYSFDHPLVLEVIDYFKKVQMEEDMRDYILTLLASYVDGHTKLHKFVLWSGSGCHAVGTKIMMYDGSCKNVEDIVIGDQLMGDDSKPRNVLRLFRGNDDMYKVIPNKGEPYVVNKDHVLSLKYNNTNIKDIKVKDFLKLNFNTRSNYFGYKNDLNGDFISMSNLNFEYVGKDNYYGFELDGNGRYLMGDLTVTHNSNGKSTTVELFQKAFGDYCGIMPTTILTKKRNVSGAATPELADKRGVRFVIIQEPEHDDKIHVGYMKELVGGDWVYARPLYGDPFRFKPQFKLLLTCNKLPYVPSNDGGTWRRLRVSPWESEFVDIDPDGTVDGKPLKPNQYSKDYDVTDKMNNWKGAFMWYLLKKYYIIYKNQGLKEPEKVLKYTKEYKKSSDIYLKFLDENLTKTGKRNDFESLSYIYSLFKMWYKDCNSNSNCPTRQDLEDYLTTNDYQCDKKYIYGVKTIVEEEPKNELDQQAL